MPAFVVTLRLKRWPARNGRAAYPARPESIDALERELRDRSIDAIVDLWPSGGMWIALRTVDDVAALTRYAASQLPADCAAAHHVNQAMRAMGIDAAAQATRDGGVHFGAIAAHEAMVLYECLTGRSSGTAAHALDLDDLQDLYTLAGLLEPAVCKAARDKVAVVVRPRARPEIVLGNVTPLHAADELASAIANTQRELST